MRADRLLSLLLLLQRYRRLRAADLAERLEVSERTIYRDLDALSAAGVPVYAERGPRGGCVLRDGYRTDLTGLNTAEVASLFAGTAARALDGLGLGPDLQRAVAKLEASLPGPRRAEAERVRERVYVDAAAWFGGQEPTPHLGALRDALFADRVVQLRYRRGDGAEAARRVAPLGLVVKGGIWYLVGLRRPRRSGAPTPGEVRVFRVSRVRGVRVTREGVRRPPGFDLAAFWGRWSRDFTESIPQYRVRLRAQPDVLPVLPQVLGERVRPIIEAAKPSRLRPVTLELTFDSLDAACGKVLGLGSGVEVLAPAALRAAVRERAEAVVRLYAG